MSFAKSPVVEFARIAWNRPEVKDDGAYTTFGFHLYSYGTRNGLLPP